MCWAILEMFDFSRTTKLTISWTIFEIFDFSGTTELTICWSIFEIFGRIGQETWSDRTGNDANVQIWGLRITLNV